MGKELGSRQRHDASAGACRATEGHGGARRGSERSERGDGKLKLREHVRRDLVHVERFEGREWASHTDEGEDGGAADANFEGAL